MLLLGGPAHGQERELADGETEIIVMSPTPGNPLPTPFKYVVRGIEAETRPGMVFRKYVLIEQGMPYEVATQALASVLLTRFSEELLRQFMEGGDLVQVNLENGTNGIDQSADAERTDGLVIAKR